MVQTLSSIKNSKREIILNEIIKDSVKDKKNYINEVLSYLKEKEENIGTQKTSSGMRRGLFKYFVDHRNDRQTIVLENEIPNIDYEDANLIPFTRVEGKGRFGLLLDYRE